MCLSFSTIEGLPFLATIMSRPEEEEVLFTYIAVASYVVSLVLVRVENGV